MSEKIEHTCGDCVKFGHWHGMYYCKLDGNLLMPGKKPCEDFKPFEWGNKNA